MITTGWQKNMVETIVPTHLSLPHRNGVDNISDAVGYTALPHAAISGSVEIINIILDTFICVDVTNA
jgi:ankyrin repeat protein